MCISHLSRSQNEDTTEITIYSAANFVTGNRQLASRAKFLRPF